MQLKNLLNNIEIIDINIDLNAEIASITSDSRKIGQKDLFVAIKGEQRDGNLFINDAILNGAAAIVTDNKEACLLNRPYILVKNSRSAISILISNYYGNPTKDMTVIGITGTNGKTSTAYFLYSILKTAKKRVGLVSTIECLINDEVFDHGGGSEVVDKSSAMTTPDPEKLYFILNVMKKKGIEYVIIESSSHALKQSKLDGTHIDVGVFTNLSREHMDYHKDMEDYFKAKEILIQKSNIGVVNIDDLYGKALFNKYKSKLISFSYKEKADYYATNDALRENNSVFSLKNSNDSIMIETNILGEYAIYNSSMAACCAEILEIDREYIIEGIKKVKYIKGRLERYKDKSIYIDYAHTPKATEMVLRAIKNIQKNKRIIVLFGCGGNRDKGKRKEIGKICSEYADVLIITSDNARDEDPIEIIKDILKGIDKTRIHMVIPNRKDAILYACKILDEASVLILLGKGHELYEIDKNGKHFFDERAVLDEAYKNDKN